MPHRVDPRQLKEAILETLAELNLPPRTPGHPGDHLGAEIVSDVLVLSTACIHNDHLQALHQIIHERAAQVGVELED